MVNLISSLRNIKPIKALVVGDLVLDSYIQGVVERVSPEAPVPVVHAKKIFSKPGMAGNVALNLKALGAEVFLAGRLGNDRDGDQFLDLLVQEKINCDNVIKIPGYQTPVKQRVIASSQQLLRIDFEEATKLSPESEKLLLERIDNVITSVDVIAISDYLKGFLTEGLLKGVIAKAKENNIPVIVDPKGKDFSKYEGATLVKPNQLEAYVASNSESETSIDIVANKLLKSSMAENILITRSSKGMSLYQGAGLSPKHFPTKAKEVLDVTGAGDTVLSMLCLAIGSQLPLELAAELSNIAASIAVKKLGCVSVSFSEIAETLLKLHADSKRFDEDHLFALSYVLKERPFTLLVLEDEMELSLGLYSSIKELSCNYPEKKLVVYLDPDKNGQEFVKILLSLNEVDFVIEKSTSVPVLKHVLNPDHIYRLVEDKICLAKDPIELLKNLKNELSPA